MEPWPRSFAEAEAAVGIWGLGPFPFRVAPWVNCPQAKDMGLGPFRFKVMWVSCQAEEMQREAQKLRIGVWVKMKPPDHQVSVCFRLPGFHVGVALCLTHSPVFLGAENG